MMYTEKSKMSFFERLISAAILLIAAYLFFKYAIGIFVPFITAYIVSLVIYPVSCHISKATKVPQRVVSAVLVILIIALLAFCIYLCISRIIGEAGELIERFENADESLIVPIKETVEKIRSFLSRFTLFERIGSGLGIENFGEKATQSVIEALYSMLSKISLSAASFIGKLPEFFIGFFVSVMAAYYFVSDRDRIGNYMSALMPKKSIEVFKNLGTAMKKYAKAYLVLMLLTFVESLIGLIILGVNYSFITAILITVVDLLPIFGAGTVLVPWAIAAFLMNNYSLATGLLILYGVMMIIRQIVEPKIIGSSIGLHPLASLFSVYLGFRLFGVLGMILGPAAALIIKEFFSERAEPWAKNI